MSMRSSRQGRLRIGILTVIVLSLFAALFARLWYLQVLSESEFTAKAESIRTRTIIEQAPRGKILDVTGNVLVENRSSIRIVVDKETLALNVPKADRPALYLKLAQELSRSGRLTKVSTIEEAVASNQFGPFASVPVIADISQEFALFLAERSHEFPGIGTEVVQVRDYPYGQLAAHVLGYVGSLNEDELAAVAAKPKTYQPNDEIGKTGVEAFYEDFLRGTPGRRVVEVDNFNNIVKILEDRPAIAGSDVQLTIDINVQALAEDKLAQGLDSARWADKEQNVPRVEYAVEGIIEFPADAGAFVIMDPNNGDVVAMASYPTYDPGLFVNGISGDTFAALSRPDSGRPLLNRVIQGTYPPGSTFKPFAAYAALDTGLLGPRGVRGADTFMDDKGVFIVPGCLDGSEEFCEYTNPDREAKGPVDLELSLALSSDVYYYDLAAQFDIRSGFDRTSVQNAAVDFGYGAVTGLSLPNESVGRIPTPASRRAAYEANPEAFFTGEWLTGDTVITSIGQGDVLATPIQIANSYAALANGGTLYAPNIASAILDPVTGEPELEFGARLQRTVYYPEWMQLPINNGLLGATGARSIQPNVPGLSPDNQPKGTAVQAFSDSYGPEEHRNTDFNFIADFPMSIWPVAGKTGTSEVFRADGTPKADNALFAGFGPFDDPQYVVVVVMESAGFGGAFAAPVARSVLEPIALGDVPVALTLTEQLKQAQLAADQEQTEKLVEEAG